MQRLLEKGKLEEAALIGLLYQMPIRVGDAVTLRKSDLSERYVLKTAEKSGEIYRKHSGSPFRISKQLNNLLLSVNKDSDVIFTKSKAYYQKWFRNHYKDFGLYDFRRAYRKYYDR